MNKKFFLLPVVIAIIFSSCVPQRKYQDAVSRMNRLVTDSSDFSNKINALNKTLADNTTAMSSMQKQLDQLAKDTSSLADQYRKIDKLNKDLNILYEKVIQQNKDLLATSSKDKQDLAQQLADKKNELDKKEQQLNLLQTQLNDKQKNMDALQDSLDARQKRVNDLEDLISKQNNAITDLKTKITNALTGFDKNDLTVSIKDGKVYVSMSEQLLFKSGSTAIDPKGQDALKKLADVLQKNLDIEVLVEGHTDNVPYHGSGDMKDNWDLSVMRATAVSKVLITGGLDAKRIIASGRSEYHPVADNTSIEGKAKNRRTEIILSPNLTSLFDLLNSK